MQALLKLSTRSWGRGGGGLNFCGCRKDWIAEGLCPVSFLERNGEWVKLCILYISRVVWLPLYHNMPRRPAQGRLCVCACAWMCARVCAYMCIHVCMCVNACTFGLACIQLAVMKLSFAHTKPQCLAWCVALFGEMLLVKFLHNFSRAASWLQLSFLDITFFQRP